MRPRLDRAYVCCVPRPLLQPSSSLPIAEQADGFTYERIAIEQWLENHNTSPKTGIELESKQLVPNYSLRSLIQDFHKPGA